MPKPRRKTLIRTARDRLEASTKRGRRGSSEPIVRTASMEDAPIEAWQQAMLPKLKEAADALELAGATESAFVFLYHTLRRG